MNQRVFKIGILLFIAMMIDAGTLDAEQGYHQIPGEVVERSGRQYRVWSTERHPRFTSQVPTPPSVDVIDPIGLGVLYQGRVPGRQNRMRRKHRRRLERMQQRPQTSVRNPRF